MHSFIIQLYIFQVLCEVQILITKKKSTQYVHTYAHTHTYTKYKYRYKYIHVKND